MRGMIKLGIISMVVIAMALLLLNRPEAHAQGQETTTTTLPTFEQIVDSNTIERVTGKTHIASVSAAPQFTQNSTGQWQNITDYINLSLTTNGLNISWEGNYMTLEPMLNYSDTVYTWSNIPLALRTAIVNRYDITKGRGSYKWAFNVSKIPDLLKNNVKGVGFNLIANNTPISLDGVALIGNNKVSLDFSDVLQHFNISSSNAMQVWITNVSGLNEIYIDPIVTVPAGQGSGGTVIKGYRYRSDTNGTALDIGVLNEYSAGDYVNINTSDNSHVGNGGVEDYAFHIYNLSLITSNLLWINFTFEAQDSGNTGCDIRESIDAWNYTSGSWQPVLNTPWTNSDITYTVNLTGGFSNWIGVDRRIFFSPKCADLQNPQFSADFAQFQYEYVPNTAPTIQSAHFNGLDWGASSDLRLLINVTDVDGQVDISAVWINGTSIVNYSRIDTNFYVLDINASRAYTYYIYANDSANATVTANFSFAVSNATQNETNAFAKTLSAQVIELNNTLNMTGGTFSGFNYTINISTLFPGVANLSPVNIIGTVTPTANATFFTNWSSDWITDSGQQNETAFENRTRNHTLWSQYIINQTNISITNHANVTFSGVSVSPVCTNNQTAENLTSYQSSKLHGNCTWTEYIGDWLVESGLQNETVFENSSRGHTNTVQYWLNQTNISVRNSNGVLFSNVATNNGSTIVTVHAGEGSGGTVIKAYMGSQNGVLATLPLGAEYVAVDYVSVNVSDDVETGTSSNTNLNHFHRYNLTLNTNSSNVLLVNFTFEGRPVTDGCSNSMLYISIWNFTGGKWNESYNKSAVSQSAGGVTYTYSFTKDFGDFIRNYNATASEIEVAVIHNCTSVDFANQLFADYVSFQYEYASASLCSNNLTISNISGGATITQNNCTWTEFSGDFISEGSLSTDFVVGQNASRTHTLSTQYRIVQQNRTLTNNQPFSFSNVSVLNACSNVGVNTNNMTWNFSASANVVIGNCTWAEESSDYITSETIATQRLFENQSRSQSLTSQFVINETHLNASNSQSFAFTGVSLSGTCTNTAAATVNSGASQITANCTWDEFSADSITETEFANRTFQNRTNPVHNQSQQFYINETYLNLTNNWGTSFLNVSWSNSCENTANGTVNTGTNQVTQNCSWAGYAADFVNESRNRYNVTDADIVMNRISSGYAEIRVQMLSFNLTNLTINSTPLLPGGWENASGITENYTLDINATQVNFRNVTINRTSNILFNVSIPSSECPSGATVFGSHCYNTSTTFIGNHNYTVRTTLTQFNVSDSVTSTFPLVLAFEKSFYPEWAGRDTEQPVNVYVNNSGTNMSFSENSTHILLHIGTDHASSSLSASGTYTAKVVYHVLLGGTPGPSPSGGGGGGGTVLNPVVEKIIEKIMPVVEKTQEEVIQAQIAAGEAFKSPVVKAELLLIGTTMIGIVLVSRFKAKRKPRIRYA